MKRVKFSQILPVRKLKITLTEYSASTADQAQNRVICCPLTARTAPLLKATPVLKQFEHISENYIIEKGKGKRKMRNLNNRMEDIKTLVSDAIKDCQRSLKIIEENLKNSSFDNISYGEAKVIEDRINAFESSVEEEVVKTIARFQPMAINLRFLVSVIKISMTVERMNDLCINILKVMKHSKNMESYKDFNLMEMLEKVQHMFDLFTKSYYNEDLSFSYLILSLDEEVNAHKSSIIEKLKEGEIDKQQLEGLFISQHLERIGDSIKNLAEVVVYIYNGIDIRHGISN